MIFHSRLILFFVPAFCLTQSFDNSLADPYLSLLQCMNIDDSVAFAPLADSISSITFSEFPDIGDCLVAKDKSDCDRKVNIFIESQPNALFSLVGSTLIEAINGSIPNSCFCLSNHKRMQDSDTNILLKPFYSYCATFYAPPKRSGIAVADCSKALLVSCNSSTFSYNSMIDCIQTSRATLPDQCSTFLGAMFSSSFDSCREDIALFCQDINSNFVKDCLVINSNDLTLDCSNELADHISNDSPCLDEAEALCSEHRTLNGILSCLEDQDDDDLDEACGGFLDGLGQCTADIMPPLPRMIPGFDINMRPGPGFGPGFGPDFTPPNEDPYGIWGTGGLLIEDDDVAFGPNKVPKPEPGPPTSSKSSKRAPVGKPVPDKSTDKKAEERSRGKSKPGPALRHLMETSERAMAGPRSLNLVAGAGTGTAAGPCWALSGPDDEGPMPKMGPGSKGIPIDMGPKDGPGMGPKDGPLGIGMPGDGPGDDPLSDGSMGDEDDTTGGMGGVADTDDRANEGDFLGSIATPKAKSTLGVDDDEPRVRAMAVKNDLRTMSFVASGIGISMLLFGVVVLAVFTSGLHRRFLGMEEGGTSHWNIGYMRARTTSFSSLIWHEDESSGSSHPLANAEIEICRVVDDEK